MKSALGSGFLRPCIHLAS